MGEAKRKRDQLHDDPARWADEDAPRWSRAAEPETGELLGVLVRMLRPGRIAECGTWPGRTTRYLADAARACSAIVDTVERVGWMAEEMRAAFAKDPVDVRSEPITDFSAYSLTFIDSGPTYAERLEDWMHWDTTAPPLAIAVLDDVGDGWVFPMLVQQNLVLPSKHGLLVVQKR